MTTPYFNLHRHGLPENGEFAIISIRPDESMPTSASFSCGLHPWYLPEDLPATLCEVRRILADSRCVALGECGLDRVCETPWERQIEAFSAQVELACEVRKPLILHMVKAWQELIAAKRSASVSRPWIVHGFRGGRQVAEELLRHGFHLSFGAALLNSGVLCETLKAVPEDRFFLETDDSEIRIDELYRLAAEIRRVPIHGLRKRLHERAIQSFMGDF